MKTLYVLRHAKSGWGDASLPDFERTLNERGLRDAVKMGELMRENNLIPDCIISSPAKRARQTAEHVKEAGKFTAEINFESKIYEASVGDLIEVVSNAASNCEKLLIVGHNPGFEHLVGSLTGEYQPMPTAAVAIIELQIKNWNDIVSGGNLVSLYVPKHSDSAEFYSFKSETKTAGN